MMERAKFQLNNNFLPSDLTAWHRNTQPGDMAIIALPGRDCKVQLIRGYRESVCWWPEGGRSMTIPLENAMARLAMLQ